MKKRQGRKVILISLVLSMLLAAGCSNQDGEGSQDSARQMDNGQKETDTDDSSGQNAEDSGEEITLRVSWWDRRTGMKPLWQRWIITWSCIPILSW